MSTDPIPQTQDIGNGSTIEYYDDALPAFAAEALCRLYGTIFSSLAHMPEAGKPGHAQFFGMRRDGVLTTAFLLAREGRQLRVMNEGIALGDEEATALARFLFARQPDLSAIVFHAVEARFAQLPFPCHRFNILEDIVLAMPDRVSAYDAQLGPSTRSYCRRYLNKLRRELPGCRFEVLSRDEVREEHIRAIVDLNRRRMAARNKRATYSEQRIAQTARLVRDHGFIGIFRMDGMIRAGTINFHEGPNYFLDLVAHDSALDAYRLGTLCCYLTIRECIDRGGRDYHFLWGENAYKYRLQGVRRDLDHLVVYRSRRAMLAAAPTLVRNAALDYRRRLKRWLDARQRRAGVLSGLIGRARDLARATRRACMPARRNDHERSRHDHRMP